MILSIYIKIISKEKILKYAATSMFLYINILSSLEKKKKILAIKNENEKVTVKILEQTVFILLKFFPACNLAYSGISNPLKELTKKLANIKTGITIPFIRPYFEPSQPVIGFCEPLVEQSFLFCALVCHSFIFF